MITEEAIIQPSSISDANVNPKSEFDAPWKDILDLYFEQFIAFCLPERHSEIDWSNGYKILDKELHKITRNAPLGNRIADKLFEIYLKNGKDAYVLLHLEVQKNYDITLEERMFISRYRLRDLHKKPIISLVILIDDNKNWRPYFYREELWDTYIEMKFQNIKIIDYKNQKPMLEMSTNPFAAVILAQLAVLDKEQGNSRLISKVNLIKWLYQRGWKKEDVLSLLRFIDWVIALPPELEVKCREEINTLEEEIQMKYVTSWERMGFAQGFEQGDAQGFERGNVQGIEAGEHSAYCNSLISLLELKFKFVPENYRQKIAEANNDSLKKWTMRIINSNLIDDVFNSE